MNLVQAATRPNSGFKAQKHVPKNICLGISECSRKIRKNMT